MVQLVQIHSLALLNISDQLSRKISGKIGVLLGNVIDDTVVIAACLEIKANQMIIDWEHLHKQLSLMKVVQPQYKLIGVYNINEDTTPNQDTKSLVDQFQSFSPLIYVVFGNRNLSNEDEFTSSYDYVTHTRLQTSMKTSSVESIVTNTINSHQYYSRDPLPSNNDEISEGINTSLEQLELKVRKILTYNPQEHSLKQSLELNNSITHLANKLRSFKELNVELNDNTEFPTTQLSLLTSQLSALDNLKAQIATNIIRCGMNSRSQSQASQFSFGIKDSQI